LCESILDRQVRDQRIDNEELDSVAADHRFDRGQVVRDRDPLRDLVVTHRDCEEADELEVGFDCFEARADGRL